MNLKNKFNYPNLPVPDKHETLEKFLVWLEPLVSNDEFKQSQEIVKNYINSPISDKIHNFLLSKANNKDESWLADWWYKYMYLSSRGPITPECNAPMIFDCKNKNNYTVSELMSFFAYKIATVYLDLIKNDFLIDDQLNPKKAFSLDQLGYFLASIREPNIDFDTYYTAQSPSDFIIIYKNNIAYKLKVIKDNTVLDLNTLNYNIKKIIESDDKQDIAFNFVSAYTDRDQAKHMLDDLLKSEINVASYQDIKDAIVILSYDDIQTNDTIQVFKNFLNGLNFNRFHGKSLSISFDNSKNITFCADHTRVDGGTELWLFHYVGLLIDSGYVFENPASNDIYFDKLNFELNNDQINLLSKEYEKFVAYLANVNIQTINTNKITRPICKELGIVSADGFIQLLFQIAQYKTNQKIFNTYVAVDTRCFYKGRTECIRPVSNESKQFAIDFVNNKITSKEQAVSLLKPIFDIHYQRSKQCQDGLGVNRYLLGIKLAFNENKDSWNETNLEFIDSLGYKIISQNILSTSSIVSPNVDFVYFDPVDPNGIGIFYAMKDDATRISISNWVKDDAFAKSFKQNLEWAIDSLVNLLKGA